MVLINSRVISSPALIFHIAPWANHYPTLIHPLSVPLLHPCNTYPLSVPLLHPCKHILYLHSIFHQLLLPYFYFFLHAFSINSQPFFYSFLTLPSFFLSLSSLILIFSSSCILSSFFLRIILINFFLTLFHPSCTFSTSFF